MAAPPLRLLGALLGAVAGLAAMLAFYAAGQATGLATWAGFVLAIGPDGIFSPERGAPLAWAVPSVAAAIAGFVLAPRTVRGAPWSGVSMGYVTYFLAILAGPIFVLLLPVYGTSAGFPLGESGALDTILQLVFGIGVIWFLGTVALTPILIACVLGGIGWAALLRAAAGSQGTARPSGGGVTDAAELGATAAPGATAARGLTAPIVGMIVVGGVLVLLWLLMSAFLDILIQSQQLA